MRDERWAEVWKLFNSAHNIPSGPRTALLESNDLDPEVRSEVLALLEVSYSCNAAWSIPGQAIASPEYPVGYEFGRHMIVGLIGQGGSGRIYAAHDKVLRRVVALKVLAGPLLGQSDRLMEEARAASALNHPNIVTVYETIIADDHLAIVMEFVDGQSLRQLLHGVPLPVEKVIRYGRQVSEALRAAHQAGITHRDVKPENILVRKDEYVKLVDFGLATNIALISDDQTGHFAGTLRYSSPEQLNGETASQASDIFSFGLVLYEMTTGMHAFQGESPLDAAGAILSRQAVPPLRKVPRIPPRLDRLIMAMLAKNPADRPSSAEIVRSLEQIGGDSARRFQGRRAWLTSALVATVGVAAFVIPQWIRKPAPLSLRLDSRPLTGEEGMEAEPAISPDGRFVVYTWKSTAKDKPVALVREIGSDRKTVLPIAGRFSWLPDSEHIGFVRRGHDRDAVCTIAKDGTGEQEILKAGRIDYAEWTPDGEWIVYVGTNEKNKESHALFLWSTKTRQTRQLTFPSDSTPGDERFAISPDGKQVAFRRALSYADSDIWVAALPVPGSPRQVTFNHLTGDNLAWTSNGKAIVSSMLRGSNYSLWLQPLNSSRAPSRLTEIGLQVTGVRSARQRDRLVWRSALDDTNIWSVPITGGTPHRVISSTMLDLDVTSSSLGVLGFRSDRSGFPEIWIASSDGKSQKKVTSLEGRSGSPRWSPDGRRLVFDSRVANNASDIYLLDCDPLQLQCGPPVRITEHPATDAIPNWSADGKSIYFASQRTGQWQIWKLDVNDQRREPVQITTKGGFFATESPDGRWLYYSRAEPDPSIGVWRKGLPGNSNAPFRPDDEGEMLFPLEFRASATWSLSGREIIYSFFGDPEGLWAYDLETRRKRMIHSTGNTPLARGLAVSPGAKTVFFAQQDRWQSSIVVADYEMVK